MERERVNLEEYTAETVTINGESITAALGKYDGMNAFYTIIAERQHAPRVHILTYGDTESARRQGDRLLQRMNCGA